MRPFGFSSKEKIKKDVEAPKERPSRQSGGTTSSGTSSGR
jgi:hypothetical protein